MRCDATEGSLALIGGGNIGSQAGGLLARNSWVKRMVVVDPDRYGPENLVGQNITPDDVGERKVDVMARQLRRIRRDIRIETHAAAVEDVPLGQLRAAAIAGAVDSRRSRQAINTVAFRLGIPWVDAAVDAGQGLVRVAVYGPEGACLECRWGEADYRLLETTHPCGAANPGQRTDAPVELGALAAALQAATLRRLLAGEADLIGRELYVNPSAGTMFASRLDRRPTCRFDHQAVRLQGTLPLDRQLGGLPDRTSVAVESHGFVTDVVCVSCGVRRSIAPVLDRRAQLGTCQTCGMPLEAYGMSIRERLPTAAHPDLTLADLGFEPGDYVHLESSTAGPVVSEVEARP